MKSHIRDQLTPLVVQKEYRIGVEKILRIAIYVTFQQFDAILAARGQVERERGYQVFDVATHVLLLLIDFSLVLITY